MIKRLYSVIRDDLRRLAGLDARAGEPLGKCMREAADAMDELMAAYERMFEERRKIQEHNAELLLLLEQAKKFIDTHKAP